MAETSNTYQRRGNYSDARRNQQQLLEREGRVAPRDLEVEQAVLGALMLEKDAYTTVCDILKPSSSMTPVTRRYMRPYSSSAPPSSQSIC